MILKKLVFVLSLFLFSFVIISTGSAETFTPYEVPDIKNDFCGKSMSAYHCKCAWHGQYCDDIGMTQNEAVSYVTNEFHKWVKNIERGLKEDCEGVFQTSGHWTGEGCLRCEFQKNREILLDGKCKSINDLCSDDPNVRYTGNGTCECMNGGILTAENRCETPCESNDPYLFYDKEIGECVCKKGYLFDGDKCIDECGDDPNIYKNPLNGNCMCTPGGGFILIGEAPHYSCVNSCGNDPHIRKEMGKCVCDAGFVLMEEDGEWYCDIQGEPKLMVDFPEAQPPFVADGKGQFFIHVILAEPETKKGVKATFKLKSGTGHAVGKILNVEEHAVGEYTLTYEPPELATGINSASDYLFVFFHSSIENKEIYKTHEIGLVSGVPIVIKKEGFEDQESVVVFYTPESKVFVYTKTTDGKKIPIQDAQVGIKGKIGTEVTDAEGVVLLSSPKKTTGNKMAETEVFLAITPIIKEFQSEANAQYQQIAQGKKSITNSEVKDFIQNFEKYIAQSPADTVENLIIGLRRVGYALLYMTEGRELSNDIAKEVALSVKNQIADTLDLIGASEKINDRLKEKISTEKLDGLATQAKEKFQALMPTFNEKINKLTGHFQKGVVNVLKSGIKKYAPNFQDDWTDEIFGYFFDNPLESYSQEDLIEKGTEKIQNWTQDQIQLYIEEFLQTKYDKMLQSQMKELEEMIRGKIFDMVSFETNRQNAKEKFMELRSKYMQAHEISFNVSFVKDSADLLNNTLGEAGKITGLWKAQAEAVEKAYKAFRSGILNNVEIFYWFRGYGDFYYDVQQNINEALGISCRTLLDKGFEWEFFPSVYAEVAVDLDSEVLNLGFAEDELALLNDLETINDSFLEIFPEDENLKSVGSMIRAQKPELQETVELLQALVGDYQAQEKKLHNQLDTHYYKEGNWFRNTTIVVVTGVLILLFFWRFKKMFLRKKK